jgi:predicted secreted protein
MSQTKEIQTQKGKIVIITLRANPSSGYEWIPEFDPTAIELISKEFVPINNLLGGDTSQKLNSKL